MGDFWSALATRAQNLGLHWASYTMLGSFFLYVLGYLTQRFHLAMMGIGTDLSVIDERYLFTGARFLIYLVSSVPCQCRSKNVPNGASKVYQLG